MRKKRLCEMPPMIHFEPMRIALGADRAGIPLKQEWAAQIAHSRPVFLDDRAFSTESTDYPDNADLVARTVASERGERGTLVLPPRFEGGRHARVPAAIAALESSGAQ